VAQAYQASRDLLQICDGLHNSEPGRRRCRGYEQHHSISRSRDKRSAEASNRIGGANGVRQKSPAKTIEIAIEILSRNGCGDAKDTIARSKLLIRLFLLDETCGSGWGKLRLL
jgi:hypothetical protein